MESPEACEVLEAQETTERMPFLRVRGRLDEFPCLKLDMALVYSVKIQRMQAAVLDLVAWSGNEVGDPTGSQEVYFLERREPRIVVGFLQPRHTITVRTPGRWFTHSHKEKVGGENVGRYLRSRHTVTTDPIGFIVQVRFTKNWPLGPRSYVTIYRIPAGYTVTTWIEELYRQQRQLVNDQIAHIDAESQPRPSPTPPVGLKISVKREGDLRYTVDGSSVYIIDGNGEQETRIVALNEFSAVGQFLMQRGEKFGISVE